MLLSDVYMTSIVTYIQRNSRTEMTRRTKISTMVDTSHVSRTPLSRSKGRGDQAALARCSGRPTCTYSYGDISICVHDVYRVTTCTSGRGISWRPPVYSLYS